jgi:hypothetical protein
MTNREILQRVKNLEDQIQREIVCLQEIRTFNFFLEGLIKDITLLREEIEND